MRSIIPSAPIGALVTTLFMAATSFAYEPNILADIVQKVLQVADGGQQPVVVMDLDDTLINTRERTLRILHDFAALPLTRTHFAKEAEHLAQAQLSQMRYALKDTLAVLGIDHAAFAQQLGDFWFTHFFSNQYCSADQPNPGAVAYAQTLAKAGARLVYLTGRDHPRMGDGTQASLQRLGFPLGEKVLLLMKSSAQDDDLQYKKTQFDTIATLGLVVAAFDNEPENINALQSRFPEGVMVFVDTVHSAKPVAPNAGVHWVRDFLGEWL